VRLDEIERNLHEYLLKVKGGETFLVTESNQPIAQITPVQAPATILRPIGLYEGLFVVPDDFDDPSTKPSP